MYDDEIVKLADGIRALAESWKKALNAVSEKEFWAAVNEYLDNERNLMILTRTMFLCGRDD